jgi:drug/metabolite transporter (DMT)-like permease
VGAGLATVLGNVQVVLVPLAAWLLLSERPAGRIAAAVPIVLIGVVLISGVIGERAYGSDPGLGVLFGVLTAVAYAGFLLIAGVAVVVCGIVLATGRARSVPT